MCAPVCKGKLCEENLGLARLCARRLLGRGVEWDELYAQACAALALAAARFDETRGVRFSTYAVPCVLGELRRYCSRAPMLSASEAERALLRRAEVEREAFLTQNAREPTTDELALALNVSVSALVTAYAMREGRRMQTDDALDTVADPVDFTERVLLDDVIARLPAPMPALLSLRFRSGLTQTQAASALGLTQSNASRLEARAKALLRDALGS